MQRKAVRLLRHGEWRGWRIGRRAVGFWGQRQRGHSSLARAVRGEEQRKRSRHGAALLGPGEAGGAAVCPNRRTALLLGCDQLVE